MDIHNSIMDIPNSIMDIHNTCIMGTQNYTLKLFRFQPLPLMQLYIFMIELWKSTIELWMSIIKI